MRLFLAIDLPPAVRAGLAAWQDAMRAQLSGWRWLRADSIHLTLRFLGEVDGARAEGLLRGWEPAVAVPPFRIVLHGVGTFPPRGAPRVLWIGAGDEPEGRLGRLAEGVERRTRELGFAPERRPFRPHLTVARAAGRGGPAAVPPHGTPAPVAGLDVGEVTLFRSELLPGGARYTALATFALGRAELDAAPPR